jgi:hypothetical protein
MHLKLFQKHMKCICRLSQELMTVYHFEDTRAVGVQQMYCMGINANT